MRTKLAPVFVVFLAMACGLSALVACSSDGTPAPSSSSSSSSSSSTSGAPTTGFGVVCTNPINSGAGGGAGGGGTGGTVDGGGVDPKCTGEYNLCASVGAAVQCTKTCTYTGTTGPQANPTDCPNPPTNGMCTPRGFCQ